MKKFNNLRIETLEEKLKTSNPPFDPDPPKKNPSAVAGKYGQGYSTAKHLAQRGMAQGPKKIAEEISKSEVEHHHDEWMNSEHRPYQSDAGNDPKIHKQALRYLSTTDVPKEKHEELAMHIADKFHGSGIDEEVEQIDEISTKTLAKAAKSASDPDSDYYYGKSHDPQKFADHAKKTKDAKSAAAVQGAADAKSHYARPGHTLGSYDKLANRTPARVTSAGKANKQDVKTLKGNIQRNEEVETTHEDPLVVTRDSDGNIHTHANLSVANAIHGTDVKHQAIHTGMPVQAGKFTFELSKHHASQVKEAKEKTEYDYEGDMARGQLQSIIMNAQRVHDMLEDNDNLPEWVQSKITLAEDYISTVSNYMASEIDEMHLSFGKPNKPLAPVSAKLSDMKKYFAGTDKDQMKQKITGKKFRDMSEYEAWMKSNKTKSAMQVASFQPKGENKLDELSPTTLQNYKVAGHKKFDSIRNNTDSNSMTKKAKLEKGIKTASAKQYPKPASAPAPKADPNSRGYEKGRYMGDSVEQDNENQIDELKSSTYQSYVNKVTDPKVASKRGNTQKGIPKSIKAIGGVTRAIGKQNFAARLASAASRNF